MKNGDIVYKYSWCLGWKEMVAVPFRYRFEPVPGIHKSSGSYFKAWYKKPRTINEKRQWFNSEGYGRAKRSPLNLPDPYNDYHRADRYYDTSWKKTRKVYRQWQKNL